MHWCLIGDNDFLRFQFINLIKVKNNLGKVYYKSSPEDVYFFIKNANSNSVVVYDVNPNADHKRIRNLDLKGSHLVWVLSKKNKDLEGLPKIPKDRKFPCFNLNDKNFIIFVKSTLSDHGLKISDDDCLSLTKRLDKDDLYYSHSELMKLVNNVKGTGHLDSSSLKWIGDVQKKTNLDLLGDFLDKRPSLQKTLSNLEYQEIPPLQILSFLLNSIEKTVYVKIATHKKIEIKDLAKKLNSHVYFLNSIKDKTSRYDINTLMRWHNRLCLLDIGMKYSGVDGYTLLKSFFLEEVS